MAATKEALVKNDVKRALVRHGVWYFMPVSNGMGKMGIPDFICCMDGMFIAIETKAPGKRAQTTPNQDRRIREILEHGGHPIVVDDAQQVEDYLTFLRNRS